MNVVVLYVYPLNGAQGHDNWAKQFAQTYKDFPAEYPHDLVVVSNGERPTQTTRDLLNLSERTFFFNHDDSGFDIGAYQHVAKHIDADMMVFLGGRSYLRRSGWLKRMVELFETYGDILYGSMQVNGNIPAGIWPHVRTTGFWMSPSLMNSYPEKVSTDAQRYPFEHGPNSLTMHCAKKSGAGVGTFNGWYWMDKWNEVTEGYHSGSQRELLVGDRLSRPPYYHTT